MLRAWRFITFVRILIRFRDNHSRFFFEKKRSIPSTGMNTLFGKTVNKNNTNKNKRAQRALGRSPEDKVKGHSGSNNREPQGHNLNNFARGPFDDVIY